MNSQIFYFFFRFPILISAQEQGIGADLRYYSLVVNVNGTILPSVGEKEQSARYALLGKVKTAISWIGVTKNV